MNGALWVTGFKTCLY